MFGRHPFGFVFLLLQGGLLGSSGYVWQRPLCFSHIMLDMEGWFVAILLIS